MTDDRLRHPEIIEDLLDGDSSDETLAPLADALGDLRTHALAAPLEPDHRLIDMFDGAAEPTPRHGWRRWLQRPVVAFAGAFVVVLILGGAALAIGNRGGEPTVASAPPSSVAADPSTGDAAAAATVVPISDEVGESLSDYVSCALGEVAGYLGRSVGETSVVDRPRVLAECGLPAIPSLGPEAEEFRVDLNAWLSCAITRFDEVFPGLLTDPDSITDPIDECGEPPNPADYGITFDLEELTKLLPDITLPDVDFDSLFGDLEGFIDGLPEDLRSQLPEDFELPDFNKLFDEFRDKLPEDFDPAELDGFFEFKGPDGEFLFEFPEDFDPDALKDLFGDFDAEAFERWFRGIDPDGLGDLLDGFLKELPEDLRGQLPEDFNLDNFDLRFWFGEGHDSDDVHEPDHADADADSAAA